MLPFLANLGVSPSIGGELRLSLMLHSIGKKREEKGQEHNKVATWFHNWFAELIRINLKLNMRVRKCGKKFWNNFDWMSSIWTSISLLFFHWHMTHCDWKKNKRIESPNPNIVLHVKFFCRFLRYITILM